MQSNSNISKTNKQFGNYFNLTYALPLTHNILTIDTAVTSK